MFVSLLPFHDKESKRLSFIVIEVDRQFMVDIRHLIQLLISMNESLKHFLSGFSYTRIYHVFPEVTLAATASSVDVATPHHAAFYRYHMTEHLPWVI